MDFIIISGLSGAGKSKVASFLEDMGFYVVDNMPAPLMPRFAELCMAGQGKYDRVALVNDIRGGQTFDDLFDALEALDQMGCAHRILFVEASTETIIKRYKETRRIHPLAKSGRPLAEAVEREKTALAPVRQRSEYIIDTTALSTAKLRGELLRLFGDGRQEGAMTVNVTSFGFKYGIPIEADLVFDVRFLPNPFYLTELRNLTGLDEPVRDYVLKFPQSQGLLTHLTGLLDYLMPLYQAEGKSQLVIAIGCTGGKHRSVVFTEQIAAHLREKSMKVVVNHRDIERKH